MRILIAVSLLLATAAASPALAGCARPTGAAPVLPNGATADQDMMKSAHDATQAYVNQLEAYQACMKKQVEDAPNDTPSELKETWTAQGDAAIDAAQAAASNFSAELKSFKEKTASPAQK